MERGWVRWGKGGGRVRVLHLRGKVTSRSIAALSWRCPGRKWPGDGGWRPGHRRHAESAHLTGALGLFFHSGFQWCWAGNSVSSETVGKRVSYLCVCSLTGVSSTNSPTFNVQKAVHLANTSEPTFIICSGWAYWHLVTLWEPVMPETISSSWAEAPGESRWHCLSEGQGFSGWPIFKGFD